MPLIAMDPSETVDIVLPAYSKSTQAPTFVARQLTARERTKISRLVTEALEHEKANEPEKTDAALTAVFSLELVSWKNVFDRDGKEVPFDPARLGDLLTWEEMWELHGAAWRETKFSEAAKKKLDVQSAASGPADAAKSAPPESAKTSTP